MEGETLDQGRGRTAAEATPAGPDTLAKMHAGEFTRFDIFAGPIKDNTGKEILPAGEARAGRPRPVPDRHQTGCKYCMYWWADGITAELPALQ